MKWIPYDLRALYKLSPICNTTVAPWHKGKRSYDTRTSKAAQQRRINSQAFDKPEDYFLIHHSGIFKGPWGSQVQLYTVVNCTEFSPYSYYYYYWNLPMHTITPHRLVSRSPWKFPWAGHRLLRWSRLPWSDRHIGRGAEGNPRPSLNGTSPIFLGNLTSGKLGEVTLEFLPVRRTNPEIVDEGTDHL